MLLFFKGKKRWVWSEEGVKVVDVIKRAVKLKVKVVRTGWKGLIAKKKKKSLGFGQKRV